jgi:hypothetical protein
MKKLIEKYVFDPAQKNVVFNDYENIELERVLLITNVTKNIIIYNFANPLAGAQVLNNNILHLQYDTSTMSNTDKLQIYYDIDTEASTEDTQKDIHELLYSLYSVTKDLSTILLTISNGSVRTTVANTPSVSISGTPSVNVTGSNITNMNGLPPQNLVLNSHTNLFQNIINNIKEE